MSTTDGKISIEQIRIENVFGVRQLEFSPEGVTRIMGANETGKTSVLRAISLLLAGGHNPDALRKGTEKGEVRFRLDDGTEVYARLTKNDTYYRVEGRDDITARQLMNSIQDKISVNPVRILQARPKDRGQILLEAIPMQIDENALWEAIGEVPTADDLKITASDLQGHALEVLGDNSNGIIGKFYGQRQQLHGAKRDKQGTVSDLRQSVAQHDDPTEMRQTRSAIRDDIKQHQQEKEETIAAINEEEQNQIKAIRERAKERRESVREDFDPKIREQEKKKAAIQEKIEQAERAQQTKEIIQQRESELEDLESRYERLTQIIENLRSLRFGFAEDLPDGVQLDDDGELLNEEGVRFEHWNEQSKVFFAMRIAEMRAGDLPLIPLDGIESVVGKQRKELIAFAKESHAQFVFTEAVPGKGLSIESA